MKNKSKLFYFSIFLITISILTSAYSLYKIYDSQSAVKENLNLWNDIKDEQINNNQEKTTSTTSITYEKGLLGEVQIPRLKENIPLIEGSTEKDLEKGAVHFSGTANFGEQGNSIVLGHRDGVFRPLKDLKVNDEIVINTLYGTETYIIEQLEVVKPTDPLITQSYDYPAITLVTCYPFYYLGDAPDRYIAIGRLK
ncbi:class D sortase [Bacillus sp. JJ722]|uniref:class D sortase n=1 Tax=Bacillus sp. JJ722 TaxID=3122973 RepID=UPI002FFF7D1C